MDLSILNATPYEEGRNLVLNLKEGEKMILHTLVELLMEEPKKVNPSYRNRLKKTCSSVLASLRRGGYIVSTANVKGVFAGKKITVYRRTDKPSPLKKVSLIKFLDESDEQTVKKAKEKIVKINKISIFQIGEAEEAIKASLRAGVRRYKVELKEFMIEFKNLEKVNTMLNLKVAELKEQICEFEGNRAALSVSLISDKSTAEIKDHITYP